jgi:hypothetical protein
MLRKKQRSELRALRSYTKREEVAYTGPRSSIKLIENEGMTA